MSQHSERRVEFESVDYDPYISRVDHAKSMEDTWSVLNDFCTDENIEGICCRCFPSDSETEREIFFTSTFGFPSVLSELLGKLPAHEDPILKRSLRSFRPFNMTEKETLEAIQTTSGDNATSASGAGAALLVPVFGPLIRHGYFMYVGDQMRFKDPDDINHLHILAQVSYLRLCELFFSSDQQVPKLSKRETEVISNVAKGRSNSEIAAIIGVSDRTVETYLLRIYDKLGVRDRVRASLRAFALGLVF